MSDIERAKSILLTRGWLSHTPESFQRAVVDHGVLRKFRAGATVYRKDDPPGGMFGLVTGSLAVNISPAERGPNFAFFLRPGSWFGGAPAFTGRPRHIGIRATRATELLYLPLHAMNAIVDKDSSAWRFFALLGFAHLETAISVCDDLMIRDHTKRFTAILLHLGDCRLATPPHDRPIEIDVGQADLATMANVARTTAGAILRRLARAGYVDMSYRRIRIVAPDLLRQVLVRRSETARNRRRLAHADFELVDLAVKAKRPAVEVAQRHRRA